MDMEALHYRAYLIACDPATGYLYDRTRAAFLVSTATVAELVLRGNLTGGGVRPGQTGDAILDLAVTKIGPSPCRWKSWVRHNYRQTLAAVEERLAAEKILSPRERKVLGLASRTALKVSDVELVKRQQDKVRTILHDEAGAEAGLADATLVMLAVAGRIPGVGDRKAVRGHADRVADLTDRAGAASTGVATVLRKMRQRRMRLAMIAAQGGMGGG